MSDYLDKYDMARIGSWTLCISLPYSLFGAITDGNPPDPKSLLLLSDVNTPDEKERTSWAPVYHVDPDRIMEYLSHVPPENILWLDEVWRQTYELELGRMRETRLARVQLTWLQGHRDGSVAFDRYLDRLEKVVEAYEKNENSGPAWGGRNAYQWTPLDTVPRWLDTSFSGPHPLQVSKFKLLNGE